MNYPKTPKTPARGRPARDPLTPSLTNALSALNLSTATTSSPIRYLTKPGAGLASDITIGVGNPFLDRQVPLGQSLKGSGLFGPPAATTARTKTRTGSTGAATAGSRPNSRPGSRAGSRPGSPNKRSRSASAAKNVVNICGIETRLDVVSYDEWPVKPKSKEAKEEEARSKLTRSKSSSNLHRQRRLVEDRYIMEKEENAILIGATPPSAAQKENSPAHVARLAQAMGINPNARILKFHNEPPVSQDPLLAAQRLYVQPLYAKQNATGSGAGTSSGLSGGASAGNSKTPRRFPTHPERILDAPSISSDYYRNVMSWSVLNQLAVGLMDSTYIWNAQVGEVSHLGDAPEGTEVCSLDWSNDGVFLAIGLTNGDVELWDVEAGRRLRKMTGHQAEINSLSWNGHVASSGCQDGSIWHHDVRVAQHKIGELLGHTMAVCGLKWRPDGEMLASGGNDNVVNIWDWRNGESINEAEGGRLTAAKWTKRIHTAGVKALGWAPWQPSLLASGGGSNDGTLHFWNSTTGARTGSLSLGSQITSVHFAPHAKEIFTTHGWPDGEIMVHTYPTFNKLWSVDNSHNGRVLWSSMSPQGDVVATASQDENIRFWRLWEIPPKQKKKGMTVQTLR